MIALGLLQPGRASTLARWALSGGERQRVHPPRARVRHRRWQGRPTGRAHTVEGSMSRGPPRIEPASQATPTRRSVLRAQTGPPVTVRHQPASLMSRCSSNLTRTCSRLAGTLPRPEFASVCLPLAWRAVGPRGRCLAAHRSLRCSSNATWSTADRTRTWVPAARRRDKHGPAQPWLSCDTSTRIWTQAKLEPIALQEARHTAATWLDAAGSRLSWSSHQ
jgi:hypothetical protein